MTRHHRLTILAAACGACAAPVALAADNEVVVTGSIAERAAVEAPYAISVIDRETLRAAGAQINLSEALARVPGLMVANRSNYAQDLQITSRGYGARATFGVRGIRLLTDGIPASGPDGQGQVSQFDLGDAERVEVLRGPFSVLYGNSSGGVISLFTAPVRKPEAEGEVDVGSFGLRQARAAVGLKPAEGLEMRLSGQAMQIDGFRPQSEAKKRQLNGRLGWQGGHDSVVVLANVFSQPAQDPLGLTRAQFDADPQQTTPLATQFDTRKDQSQTQLGATWTHRYDEGAMREARLMAYAGHRSVTQYLAITSQVQTNARHGGGVVDFDRDFMGSEARMRFAWTNLDLQVGLSVDDQRDARRGYNNYTGTVASPVYGQQGDLRRDETNRARTTDAFAQAEWAFATDWMATGGLRSGRVKLSNDDHYIVLPNNGDDSGSVAFSYTNPVLGLRWQAAPGLDLHASAARGFESPTLGEIAYRPDNTSGLNFGLKPQKSRQLEVGAKWRAGTVQLDVAAFDIRTTDEIGVATNAGGRSAFQNVGHTTRRGLEVGGGWQAGAGISTRVSATWLDATYRDSFTTCVATPCNTTAVPPSGTATVPAGNRIAGTQKLSGYGELAWASGFMGDWGFELRGVSGTTVNDLNSDAAPKSVVGALRWAYKIPIGGAVDRVELLARVDNLFDRRYAGSVIVNEANGRYFEPGAPRAFLLALRVNGDL